MYNLLLSQSRKARIWVNELPAEFSFVPAGRVSKRFTSNTNLFDGRRVAVELLIPHGGSFDYGLIGGEFIPDQASNFLVIVCHSGTADRSVVDSLVGSLDDVCAGLPSEYAQAVISGIEMVGSDQPILPAGQLRICLAAYGKAGSSIFFFRRLSNTLVRMITAAALPLHEEQMSEFVDQVLKSVKGVA